MIHFIYQPKSGDRVFASRPSSLHLIRWGNGCRHIVNATRLTYFAAGSGQWWRDSARAMATCIVDATGDGVAEDDQGTIRLYVAPKNALRANQLMEAAASACGRSISSRESNLNLGSMLLSGWTATPDLRDPEFFAGTEHLFGPAIVHQCRSIDPDCGKITVSLAPENGDLVVAATVPIAWGMPQVSCGLTEAEPAVASY